MNVVLYVLRHGTHSMYIFTYLHIQYTAVWEQIRVIRALVVSPGCPGTHHKFTYTCISKRSLAHTHLVWRFYLFTSLPFYKWFGLCGMEPRWSEQDKCVLVICKPKSMVEVGGGGWIKTKVNHVSFAGNIRKRVFFNTTIDFYNGFFKYYNWLHKWVFSILQLTS
jgi:hypothetical protein